ncbi:MAG: MBL fold metallo-hydrolase [Synergistaceae bacterium]|jgi:glyoxylase-like metal-dependent hydrolase (beta-lactamase superfamily II)|nr:MBL fold metallo-hydrolase [Synergistaceae bacterium]
MFGLNQVGESTYYIDCPSKIGVCVYEGGRACLIDSGMEDGHGKRALEIIEERGWTLGMIINTHSHADHVGGNRYLQEATGCPAYAAGADAAIIRHSILNTSLLYGGNPPEAMKDKLLHSDSSFVRDLDAAALPDGIKPVRLDGHSFAMSGIQSHDGVWFLADSLVSESMLARYHIPFVRDVAKHLETLKTVEGLDGRLFIPSHTRPLAETGPLVDANRRKILEIAEKIVDLCADPVCFDDLLKDLFDFYGLQMDIRQYMLTGSTVRSFLSYLSDAGAVEPCASQDRLLWRAA